jgi:hypothetical protein
MSVLVAQEDRNRLESGVPLAPRLPRVTDRQECRDDIHLGLLHLACGLIRLRRLTASSWKGLQASIDERRCGSQMKTVGRKWRGITAGAARRVGRLG